MPPRPPSYGTIAGGAVIMLLWSAFHLQRTPRFALVSALAVLLIAPLIALRTHRIRRRLTPDQRLHLKALHLAEREEARKQVNLGHALIMLVFFVVELALFGAALFITMGTTLAALGSSIEDPAPGPFILGMALGLAIALLIVWPLEKLCKHLTGSAPLSDASDFLPFT